MEPEQKRTAEAVPGCRLSRAKIGELIEWLEHVRTRPEMYMTQVTAESVNICLWWFHLGLSQTGLLNHPAEFLSWAPGLRGWELNSLGPEREMRERGFTETQVIEELFHIEITAWQELAKYAES